MEKILLSLQVVRNKVPVKFQNRYISLCLINICLCVDKLNVTGSITSFYSFEEIFKVPLTTVSWVLAVYALTLGAFIIFFGKIGDIIGPENLFIIGTFVMALFSLLTAVVESSIYAIIVFRAFQGIAGASLIPSSFALVANYFAPHERLMPVKISAASMTASYGLGVVLGGAFAESSIGYKGLFYLTFGLSTICTVLSFFVLAPTKRLEAHKNLSFKKLDFLGVTLLVSGLLLVIIGFTEAGEKWNSPKVYLSLPIGFALVVTFFLFEMVYIKNHQIKDKNSDDKSWLNTVQPLFPAEILKIPNAAILFLGALLELACFVVYQTSLVEYYEYILNESPILASVKVLPLSVGLLCGSMLFSPIFVSKFGLKAVLMYSGAIQLGMSIWLSRFDYHIHSSYWKFEFVSQFFIGYAVNLYMVVFIFGLMQNAPLYLQGVVSGVGQTVGQIGQSFSTALVNSIVGSHKFDKNDDATKHKIAMRYRNAVYLALGFSGTIFLIV